MGLAYDRIMSLSGKYISQGYITQDDYYSLYQHLITPYLEADDEDGTVKRVSAKIDARLSEEGATNEQQNLWHTEMDRTGTDPGAFDALCGARNDMGLAVPGGGRGIPCGDRHLHGRTAWGILDQLSEDEQHGRLTGNRKGTKSTGGSGEKPLLHQFRRKYGLQWIVLW